MECNRDSFNGAFGEVRETLRKENGIIYNIICNWSKTRKPYDQPGFVLILQVIRKKNFFLLNLNIWDDKLLRIYLLSDYYLYHKKIYILTLRLKLVSDKLRFAAIAYYKKQLVTS